MRGLSAAGDFETLSRLPDGLSVARSPLEEEHHDAFGRQVPTPSIGCDAGATNAMLAAASCLVGAEVVNEV
jgi:hypothetical protein